MSGFHFHFQMLLRLAGISYGGRGKGPRSHDIHHTFAVHCLNNWVLSDMDVMIVRFAVFYPVANYILALAIDVLNVAKHNHSNICRFQIVRIDNIPRPIKDY